MAANNISAALNRFANDDMLLARQQGDVLIAQTKHGTLNLTAEKTGPRVYVYTLAICGVEPVELVSRGSAADVRAALIDSYVIEVAA